MSSSRPPEEPNYYDLVRHVGALAEAVKTASTKYDERLKEIKDDLHNIDAAIRGNGQPGLKQRMEKLAGEQSDMAATQAEHASQLEQLKPLVWQNKILVWLVGVIATLVLGYMGQQVWRAIFPEASA